MAHSNGNPFLKTRRGDDISGHILVAGAHATTINQHSPRDNRLMLPKKTSTKLWSDDYHVYDLEWKSDRITLKVDEEQYGDQEVPPSLFNNPVSTLNCKYVTNFTFFPVPISPSFFICSSCNTANNLRSQGRNMTSLFLVIF